jgi:methanethiol S-methyltransferase
MRAPSAAGPLGRALAWLGGAAFIASLSVFAWSYAVRFGRPPPRVPAALADIAWPAAWDLLLFSAFALHHSVMARSGAKRWLMARIPPNLERSVYVWVSSMLFALTCVLWRTVPVELYALTAAEHALAVLVQLTGVWVTLRAAAIIDPLDLAGIRQALGTQQPARFQVIGPYHLVRHPIYLGWVLITFGTPTMTGTRLWFAVVSSAYLALAVPFEERSLLETFGEEYKAYQTRVRWRMIPGIY